METSPSQTKLFFTRLAAKLIDFFVVYLILRLNDDTFGVILSLLYLLSSDMLFAGQSVGKRIMGLRVMHSREGDGQWVGCDLKPSAIRNSIFALILFVDVIPLFGTLLVVIGMVLLLVEVYFMFSDDEGIRIGDIYAKTRVYPVTLQTLNMDTQPSVDLSDMSMDQPQEKTMEMKIEEPQLKSETKNSGNAAEKNKTIDKN